jgi:hypothetical protein
MIPMTNLNMAVEKELELECRGELRRTRRWIGDASTDPGWYRPEIKRVSGTEPNQGEVSQVAETKSHQETHYSFLDRLYDLFSIRRRQTGC